MPCSSLWVLVLVTCACVRGNLEAKSRQNPGIVLLYSQSGHADKRQADEREPAPDTGEPHVAPKPECAGDNAFCLYDQEYPAAQVNDIVDTYHGDVHAMYHAVNHYPLGELIRRDNFTHGYRHKGHFVCESEVSYVRPGWAKNWKNQWVAVVNTDKYPQSVRTEVCKYEGVKCEYLPPCYKSFCVQRNTYVKLLCVDPSNKHHRPVVDVFEIPSACSCFVENFVYY